MKYKNILHSHHCGYSEAEQADKLNAHRVTMNQLRKVAVALGLANGSYDLRSNKGGVAVSGEVTLHAETIYVQCGGSALDLEHGILVRSCKGRKDYTGGHNYFFNVVHLLDPERFAVKIRPLMEQYVPFDNH